MIETKIGLGIITCNRPEFLAQVIKSVPFELLKEVVIIDDGAKGSSEPIPPHKNLTYLKNEENVGVGRSKNKAMLHLLKNDCEHIFLLEDDIIIKDKSVFDAYIKASKFSNIKHLMFGYHGPANKKDNKPYPRVTVQYGDNNIALNPNCVGGFCYYHRELLMRVGLFDEKFVNAWEHVEHSYRAVVNGYLPGYWWWPDIANSEDYLEELACSEENSTIRPRSDWKKNIKEGADYFKEIYGNTPVSVTDTPERIIMNRLKEIKTNNLWKRM